jgi:hypothetical protein
VQFALTVGTGSTVHSRTGTEQGTSGYGVALTPLATAFELMRIVLLADI